MTRHHHIITEASDECMMIVVSHIVIFHRVLQWVSFACRRDCSLRLVHCLNH